MPDNKPSSGRMAFEVTMGGRAKPAAKNSDTPFCLAVLGDFTGRASRESSESVAQRKPVLIDIDNFDSVMGKMGVKFRLPALDGSDEAIELSFASLEDFHPDEVLKQAPALSKFLELRKRLQSPSTSAAAAAELQALLSVPASAAGQAAPASTESNDAAVSRLLGKAPAAPATAKAPAAKLDISSLVKNIAAPNVVSNHPQQGALMAALDLELTRRLRAVFQHPYFQAVEAAWRGVDFLVRNLGGEENLKLFLIDVSKEELAADLQAQNKLQAAGIYSVLYTQPWAAMLGNYNFDESAGDVDVLRRMAVISAWLGAPFIAGASPHIAGCESFGLNAEPREWKRPISAESKQAWQALRQMPESNYVGLALPRFLMRQPYGKGSDEIDAFPYEELPGPDTHEAFLWGNSTFLCGYALVEAFKEEGWGMRPTGSGDISDLPLYQFRKDGETEVKPCAEAWLTDRAADVLLDLGLMPVLSIKGRDAVRLVKMQSVSNEVKELPFR
jgi:type VI secretion system protein ImpC